MDTWQVLVSTMVTRYRGLKLIPLHQTGLMTDVSTMVTRYRGLKLEVPGVGDAMVIRFNYGDPV